ncbi:MAG: carbohydrate kinase [Spirochaetales bacterium]|nr:carbohydrate kinase [Spirochaetales bacterium]
MNNVSCIGEILIDFICTDIDTNLAQGENFRKHAGGAPANVTAAIARLGGSASFIGTVGADPFGNFLKESVEKTGVDTSMMLRSDTKPTTLAFVSLKADGERDFVFNRGADAELGFEDLDFEKIRASKIVHFGSATALLEGRLQKTYIKLMELCRNEKIFSSFDPNYRGNLWKNNDEEFIRLSLDCIRKSDFIKLSEEELFLLTGESELNAAVDRIERPDSSILTITLGSRGTLVSAKGESRIIESVKIKSVDSTGAGDAFTGAFLLKTAELEDPFSLYSDSEKLWEIISFSNKVGAIVCTKLGAIAALPSLEEVEVF